MASQPLAAIQLERRTDTAGVSPRRLSVIARNRLQDLGLQAFIVGDLVRGRLLIDPSRFAPWPNAVIEAKQEFVVQGHDRFWFTKPSVLRFVGPINFYDAHRLEDIHREVQTRWADLRSKSIEFIEVARQYFPSIDLDPETWTLDVAVPDPFGCVNLRVRPHQGHVWVEVVGTDGKALKVPPTEPLFMALPPDPTMFDTHSLTPLLNRVRAGATPTAQREEAMVLELDIENTSELAMAPAASQADDSLSLDLALLSTGDLGESVPDLDLPKLEAVQLGSADLEEIRPMRARAPRLKTRAVDVVVSTATFTAKGVVRDANYGGIFIEVEEPERFGQGTAVIITGVGPFTVRGRVAHRRRQDEGTLLGTGAGIGIALMDAPVPRIERGPAPVVVLTDMDTDPERRGRFAAIVCGAQCTPIVADTLVACLIIVRTLGVRAVVLDQTFADYGWREIADAFLFDEIGVELLVVTQEALGAFAQGVRAIAPERLASALFVPA